MAKQSLTSAFRLESLDILRGFDLFLLVFFQPVFVALGHQLNLPWLNSILFQFDHEVWNGFRFWDLVMPLFLFMTGAAMPFSFSKFRNDPDKKAVYRRILCRVLLLFIFGMVVQGNLLGFNPEYIYFYTNTLQAIGAVFGQFLLLTATIHAQKADSYSYSVPQTAWAESFGNHRAVLQVNQLLSMRLRATPFLCKLRNQLY